MRFEYVTAVIAMVPGLLVPLIAWFLSQRGISRRAKKFESLLTRMELVEKLRQIQGQTSDSKSKLVGILDMEVDDILNDLESSREIQVPLTTTPPQKVTGWRRFLLLYEQVSLKGKAYKWLFYFFSLFVVVGSFGIVSEGYTVQDSIWGLLGLAIYLAIGLAFRVAAVRDYERIMKKAKATVTSS